MAMALTPYGGWHGERKDSAESWTRRTTHTGDDVGYYEFDRSTNGSNTRGEPGRARRTALSHLRAVNDDSGRG